jgi:CHAD domain-containing protein
LAAHESIYEYYLHQQRNIQYYLELCAIQPEVELVHEFRLSVKKLRAFYKLTEQIILNDTKGPEYIRHRVRKLYKVSGQLRDTQVQIQLLNTFQEQTGVGYPEFGKWLLRREKKRILRFAKKPQQLAPQPAALNTHHEIGNLLALAGDEAILNGAEKVLSGFYSEALNLSTGKMNDRNLHRIRTITKQMRYILNIMHHSYPDFLFSKISIHSLREIEAAAGQWHDNLVRIELLNRYMEKIESGNDADKFKYKKLFDACKSELDISYAETLAIVRNAVNPHSLEEE